VSESYEIDGKWPDFYKILQVDPLAEPEVIEAAYRRLSRKYHPDVDKSPDATGHMKKINRAYEVLSDPVERKRYHSEWLQKSKKAAGPQGASVGQPPKPVVDPQYIKFHDVEPNQIQTSSFIIRNDGGPYANYEITYSSMNDPDSWFRIVGCYVLTDSSELPAQAEIEAEGKDWGKNYVEYIRVKLDEEETQVRVELKTKPEPAGLTCPKCGWKNSGKLIYCERCEADLLPDYCQCPNCNFDLPRNSRFCRVCGTKL
jgi:DnaJ-class molecular chaperone